MCCSIESDHVLIVHVDRLSNVHSSPSGVSSSGLACETIGHGGPHQCASVNHKLDDLLPVFIIHASFFNH